MFTVPVGNFKRVATGYRPSANAVTVAGSGSVTDPEKAYDSDPSTYAYVNSYTTQIIYSGFGSAVASGAVLNINIGAALSGDPNSATLDISFNGGSSYDFSIPMGWVEYSVGSGIYTIPTNVIQYQIPNSLVLSGIKLRFKTDTTTAVSLLIYDIVINQ